MTRQEALAEAQKRWGKDAYATGVKAGRVEVGKPGTWAPWGTGETYEAAFADADRRANV